MCSGRGREPNRRGIATLEFVLVLPLLLAMTVMIAMVAHASLSRTTASLQARRDAWSSRDSTASATPLSPFTGPEADLSLARPSVTIPAPPEVPQYLPSTGREARSSHTVLRGFWADRDVPFEPDDTPLLPHLGPLGQIAGGAKLPIANFRAFARLYSELDSPAGKGLASIFETPLQQGAKPVMKMMDVLFNPLKRLAGGGAELLGDVAGTVGDAVGKLVGNDELGDSFRDFAGPIGDLITGGASAIVDGLGDLVGGVGDLFGDNEVSDAAKKAARAIKLLSKALDLFDRIGIGCFANLYDAAEGREGDWVGLDDFGDLGDDIKGLLDDLKAED